MVPVDLQKVLVQLVAEPGQSRQVYQRAKSHSSHAINRYEIR
jgi:hypothetical protein